MTWLLTGGAGYIGSHVAHALKAVGMNVVVLDDLSTGDARRLPPDTPLVVAAVQDAEALRRAMREHEVTGVIHLAAKKSTEESVRDPLFYYRENVVGVLTVLEAMAAVGVRRLVFSSSAAVYGTPDSDSVDESSPHAPENPYGRTKLIGEWMVQDTAKALGLSCVSLRYFNVTGCADPRLADNEGSNLFPKVMRALRRGDAPVVFGADYPTPDGSCVRDYVHVQDLAEAHVAAARHTGTGTVDEVFNIGCGNGYSVLEVLSAMGDVTGYDTTPRILDRRPGDPAGVVADVTHATEVLGWTARLGLAEMVESAWSALEPATPVGARSGGHPPHPSYIKAS